MNYVDQVQNRFGDLEYMRHDEALLMRKFIARHRVRDILELGFYHGKSSAYFAAILEDIGEGHLVTIDLENARNRAPNISEVLTALGLEHRATPVFAERSYTWELGKMVRAQPRPKFDLCYFDGGHTWDATGLGFVLVDLLLRPGGWIVFDDLDWTIESAIPQMAKVPSHWLERSADEQATPAVRMVFEILAPHLGYTDRHSVNGGRWGIARKPQEDPKSGRRLSAGGLISTLFSRR